MHPVAVLVPALALLFGPRWWVGYVLSKHNRHDEDVSITAGELARQLLDRNGLQAVRVESTDTGDHYDPDARAVRIARDRLDRKTLTALTSASHEVAHAIQHASGYGPFLWRGRLVKVAQVAGDAGAALLLAVPVAALTNGGPIPSNLIAGGALAMIGTSVVAQLAALPSELNASFGRALPMLREGGLSDDRLEPARSILLACSLTYVASSMLAILHIWPWLGRGPVISLPPVRLAHFSRFADQGASVVPAQPDQVSVLALAVATSSPREEAAVLSEPALPPSRARNQLAPRRRPHRDRKIAPVLEAAIRGVGRPLARCWLRATGTA